MTAAVLTAAEIENLRFHLGYGNLQVGAYPWTPDGFFELFVNVIALYLSSGPETDATTAVDASAGPVIVTVTPSSMTGIVANVRLVIDNGDDVETVVVKSTTLSTFTAKFTLSHDVSGYPVAVETGVTRLRELLHAADRVYKALLSPALTAVAGLQSVDKGEVVWFHGNAVQRAVLAQYKEIIIQLSRLTRVEPVDGLDQGPVTRLEAY